MKGTNTGDPILNELEMRKKQKEYEAIVEILQQKVQAAPQVYQKQQ